MKADQGDKRDWYSIAEAASYLGVSEPTIYRWMKQNYLSFYRVGGSTRFSREGLDSVIEKRTGKREAEAAAGRCASCGHSTLIAGSLQGTGKLHFRPAETKFWVFAEALVGVGAAVCVACGHVHLRADTAKLNRIRMEETSSGKPPAKSRKAPPK